MLADGRRWFEAFPKEDIDFLLLAKINQRMYDFKKRIERDISESN